jgi:translation initiation factor IF-2
MIKKSSSGVILVVLFSFVLFSFQTETKMDFEKLQFKVDGTFSLSNGQIIVTGQVLTGSMSVNDSLTNMSSEKKLNFKIELMEIFGRTDDCKTAHKGEFVGIHTSGVVKSDFRKDDTLTFAHP